MSIQLPYDFGLDCPNIVSIQRLMYVNILLTDLAPFYVEWNTVFLHPRNRSIYEES